MARYEGTWPLELAVVGEESNSLAELEELSTVNEDVGARS